MLLIRRTAVLCLVLFAACRNDASGPADGSRELHLFAADTTSPPDTTPPPPDTTPPPPDTNPPPPDTIQVARIVISPNSAHAQPGDSIGFFANLYDRRGNPIFGKNVAWVMADSSVAMVEFAFGQSANARAIAPGTARITAFIDGKRDQATIVVRRR